MKRNKKVSVDIQAVAAMVKKHYNLPPDARFKGAEFNSKSGKVVIELEHQTFDLVNDVPVVDKGSEPSEKIRKPVTVKKVSKKK